MFFFCSSLYSLLNWLLIWKDRDYVLFLMNAKQTKLSMESKWCWHFMLIISKFHTWILKGWPGWVSGSNLSTEKMLRLLGEQHVMFFEYMYIKQSSYDFHGWLVRKKFNGFIVDIHWSASMPAQENLFQVCDQDERVMHNDQLAQCFHSTVAQLLFVTIQCRRDIQTAAPFLTTRVKKLNEIIWVKLQCVFKYLNGKIFLSLTLNSSEMSLMRWWVDVLFAFTWIIGVICAQFYH